MKKLLFLILVLSTTGSFAQTTTDTSRPPYLKYPNLPAFSILAADSSSVFNTYNIPSGRPTVMIFFSPDCEHCQQTAKSIVARKNSLKDVQFYFMTPMNLVLLNSFIKETKLKELNHVMAGKDYDIFFPVFYRAKYVPFIAVYDSNKKFVKMWEGRLKIEDLMQQLNELRK